MWLCCSESETGWYSEVELPADADTDGGSRPVKHYASLVLVTDPGQFQSGMLEECAQDIIYQVYI